MRATILAFIFLFCAIHPSVGIGLARDNENVVAIKYYKTQGITTVSPHKQQASQPVTFPIISQEIRHIETDNLFLRFWKKVKMVTSNAEDYHSYSLFC